MSLTYLLIEVYIDFFNKSRCIIIILEILFIPFLFVTPSTLLKI